VYFAHEIGLQLIRPKVEQFLFCFCPVFNDARGKFGFNSITLNDKKINKNLNLVRRINLGFLQSRSLHNAKSFKLAQSLVTRECSGESNPPMEQINRHVICILRRICIPPSAVGACDWNANKIPRSQIKRRSGQNALLCKPARPACAAKSINVYWAAGARMHSPATLKLRVCLRVTLTRIALHERTLLGNSMRTQKAASGALQQQQQQKKRLAICKITSAMYK